MTAPLVRRTPVRRAQVAATTMLTPRMRRITLTCPELVGAAVRPAQDVELLLREDSGRRVKRRYTIGQFAASDGAMDLDVLLHGHGPGATWGAAAQPGDEVELQGPRGKLELRPAAAHLLVGDESALPAIASITEALPAGEPSQALIEVDGPDDELPVAAPVTWVPRAGAAPGSPDLLAGALTAVPVVPGTRAYLLGESRAMITLRSVVEARGIAHDDVFVKGYWNVGRPGR